jgi:hypothetical protein
MKELIRKIALSNEYITVLYVVSEDVETFEV